MKTATTTTNRFQETQIPIAGFPTLKRSRPLLDISRVAAVGFVLCLCVASESWLLAQQSNPQIIGKWPKHSSGSVYEVIVQESLAYCAIGSGGLAIVDVRNPKKPQGVGGYRASLGIEPSPVAWGLALAGEYAYLAYGDAGVHIVHVSEPSRTELAGAYTADYPLYDIAISGHHVYAVGPGGLQILDVRDPNRPKQVSAYRYVENESGVQPVTVAIPITVAIADNYAYVATADQRGNRHALTIIDVTVPSQPRLVGSYPGAFLDIAAVGKYGYLVDGSRMRILDISDPTDPRQLSSYDTSGWAVGIGVSGNYAYVVAANQGVQVIDVADPVNPKQVGGYHGTDGYPWMNVMILGNNAYIGAEGEGLHILDIHDPVNPQPVASYSGFSFRSLAVAGHFAYVADVRDGKLVIIDVNNPANPQPLAEYLAGSHIQAVSVVDDYAYLSIDTLGASKGPRLAVIDVSNPLNASRVGEYESTNTNWSARDVLVVGNQAYMAAAADRGGGLLIIDITEPASPRQVGEYRIGGTVPDGSSDGASSVAVIGSTAYLIGGDLHILDVSDSTRPHRVGGYSIKGWASAVAVSGAHAYILSHDWLSGQGGLLILNLTDPLNPQLVGSYDGAFDDMALMGNYAYLTGNRRMDGTGLSSGLHIIDVRNPSDPKRMGRNSTFEAEAVAIEGGKVYVTSMDDGLVILNPFAMLRFGPASVGDDGLIRLPLIGLSGQHVRIQRSANLIDWEDWKTTVIDDDGCELTDRAAQGLHRFYRALRVD